MPSRSLPRNVIRPDQTPGSKRDILWPSVNTKGGQPTAVLLLATALGLDISDPRDRHEINPLLRTAWEHMAPLLSGVGGPFSLRLEKTAEIEAVTKTWHCPLTRRVLQIGSATCRERVCQYV